MGQVWENRRFAGPPLEVARALMGAYLCRRLPTGEVLRLRIVEAEAYDGPEDRACHASRGRTARTEVMFGPAGHCYVYLCYGVHWMLNFVTGPEGYPAAVLIRGLENCIGPGRLTRRLAIDRALNGRPIAPDSGLWVESAPAVPEREIACGPRVGIDYAGPEWSTKPWRLQWRPALPTR